MFRADDVRGKEVKGWLVCVPYMQEDRSIKHLYFIHVPRKRASGCNQVIIDPPTLAMQTGILDKHKVEIYGSYPVDGIKSEGGDRVKLSYGIPPTYDILKIEYVNNEETMDMFVSGWWMRNERENGVSTSLCKTYENDLEIIGEKK